MNRLDHFKFCIGRFDHYYDSINNKSALFLAVNTFIVGGMVAMYPTITQQVDCGLWINITTMVILLTGLASIFLTLRAGIPSLGNPGNSLLYFGSIASKDLIRFKKAIHECDDEKLNEDYSEQVHELSSGLDNKFRNLRAAGYLIFTEFVLIVPFMILLIVNTK